MSLRLYTYYHQLRSLNEKFSLGLGDLVTSWLTKEMPYLSTSLWSRFHPYMSFLSPSVARETQAEVSRFLVHMLQNITGETELTWSLRDAVDLLLLRGASNLFHADCTLIFGQKLNDKKYD